MSDHAAAPSNEALATAQRSLLRAALRREPLPGQATPLRFPDLGFVLAGPAVLLDDEHLAGSIAEDDLPLPLRVLSPAAIRAEASGQDLTYLHFAEAEPTPDGVRLTLEARLVPGDESRPPMRLGGVQVVFRDVGGRWEASDDPIAYAT